MLEAPQCQESVREEPSAARSVLHYGGTIMVYVFSVSIFLPFSFNVACVIKRRREKETKTEQFLIEMV